MPGILGRLPLGVVEVRRHGDDGLGDLLAQIGFGGLLQLPQDHRGDLWRRVLLAAHLDPRVAVGRPHDLVGHHLVFLGDLVVLAAHEALDGEDGVLGLVTCLAFGDLADQPLALLGERHDRRRRPLPSWLTITVGSPPSMTATTELVVPRSMPIIFALICCPSG